MERHLFSRLVNKAGIFGILQLVLCVFLSCGQSDNTLVVTVVQKQDSWENLIPFASNDSVIGLDKATGSRKNLIQFPGRIVVSACSIPGGKLAVAINKETGKIPNDIAIIKEDGSVEKEIDCIPNPSMIMLFDNNTLFSDSGYYFTSTNGTAYDVIDLTQGKITHQDLTLPHYHGNRVSIKYQGLLYLTAGGDKDSGKSSYLLLRNLATGEETKDESFFKTMPYEPISTEIIGDTLAISYYDKNILEFWSIPNKALLKSYSIKSLITAWAAKSDIRSLAPFVEEGRMYVPLISFDLEDEHTLALAIFQNSDFSYTNQLINITNPDLNRNTSVKHLENGLLYTVTLNHVNIFNVETGALVRQDDFSSQ